MPLKAGANVNEHSATGQTTLMCTAQWNKKPDVISTLLTARANVYDQDIAGQTALMYAAQDNSNGKIISLLLNAGQKSTTEQRSA